MSETIGRMIACAWHYTLTFVPEVHDRVRGERKRRKIKKALTLAGRVVKEGREVRTSCNASCENETRVLCGLFGRLSFW